MQDVTTTVFSMPCWKSARLSEWLRRLAIAWLVCAGLMLPASQAAELEELRIEQMDDSILLFAQMQFELSPSVLAALHKGIALQFVAEASILRERWYWMDKKVAEAKRYTRLAYQPLTRRWRVNTASEPMTGSALGLGLTQHYDSLPEVLAAVQRIAGWKVANSEQLADSGRQILQFRFRLDASQLPRTLQLSAVGKQDWNLSLERRLDLSSEGPR